MTVPAPYLVRSPFQELLAARLVITAAWMEAGPLGGRGKGRQTLPREEEAQLAAGCPVVAAERRRSDESQQECDAVGLGVVRHKTPPADRTPVGDQGEKTLVCAAPGRSSELGVTQTAGIHRALTQQAPAEGCLWIASLSIRTNRYVIL